MNSISPVRSRLYRYARLAAFFALLFAGPAQWISAQQLNSSGLITLRLEQKRGNNSATVPQNSVFRNGDILRFRLTSRIAGYLYVVDKGTTGQTTTLFPGSTTTGSQNRIEPDQTMVVPAAGDGWFEVSGPSGFDTIYLLVSSTPISIPPAAAPGGGQENPQSATPSNLLPRCNDEIFKARGECIDSSAGVPPLPPDAPLPRELVPLAKSAARDIILADDGDEVTVKSAPSAKLPLIYTFRLAHLE